MWCDLQSPVMMGLQATASKRKLDYESKCPAKVVRLEEGARDVMEDWRVDSTSSVLASSLLGATAVVDDDDDDEDEEEEEEDEEEDEEKTSSNRYLPAGRGYYPYYEEINFSQQQQQQQQHQQQQQQHYPTRSASQYWGAQTTSSDYYGQDSTSQQTIRCDENGKSYLDLGSSSARYMGSASPAKCCDGSRTSWCSQGPNATCYRQRRLAVLNISMCKLGRYRQFPDPSLHRSVLICNTLRYIEREMEQEGFFFNNSAGVIQAPPVPVPPPEPSYQPQFPEVTYPAGQYEQSLRELSASGRATPFPGTTSGYDTDSGVGDDESGRGINWGSVLSLSSQSDLDPLNNNELYPSSPSTDGLLGDVDLSHELDDFLPGWKLTPLSADDILKSVPSGRQGEGELDSIMHVLVGT